MKKNLLTKLLVTAVLSTTLFCADISDHDIEGMTDFTDKLDQEPSDASSKERVHSKNK